MRPAEAYEAIVKRALVMAPESRDYIERLASMWRPLIVDKEQSPVTLFMEREALTTQDVDSIVMWVDAFPEVIA